MTIKEMIEEKDNMKEIFTQLGIKEEEYFLTGSRALDTTEYIISNINSDYDYVVDIHHRQSIYNWLYTNKIEAEFSSYNGGFKFNYEGKRYNIITVIHIELMAWREALGILQYLIGTHESYRKVIANKMSRYCLYESLRAIIKSTLNVGEKLK